MINSVEIKNTKWKKGIGLTWTTFSNFLYININIQRKVTKPVKRKEKKNEKEKRED